MIGRPDLDPGRHHDLKLVNVTDVHLGEAQLGAMRSGQRPPHRPHLRDRRRPHPGHGLHQLHQPLHRPRRASGPARWRFERCSARPARQLVTQFLGESLLLVGVAMLIALALVELAAAEARRLPRCRPALRLFRGAAASSLPALLPRRSGGRARRALSGPLPVAASSRRRCSRPTSRPPEAPGSRALRNALVVAQFAISIGLIVCTAVIYSQTRFVEDIDPGFERDGLIQIGSGAAPAGPPATRPCKREALRVPGVAAVGRTNLGVAAEPTRSIIAARRARADRPVDIGFYRIDPDFFPDDGHPAPRRPPARREPRRRTWSSARPRARGGSGSALAEPRPQRRRQPAGGACSWAIRDAAGGARQGRESRAATADDLVPSTIVGVVEDTRIRTARDDDRAADLRLRSEPHLPGIACATTVRCRREVMDGLRAGVAAASQPEFPFQAEFAED